MSDAPVTEAPAAEVTPTPAPVAEPTPAPEAEATPQETTETTPEVDPKKHAEVKREAQNLRSRLREAEAELETRKQAEMTEAEKIAARAEKAEADLALVAQKAKDASLKAAVAIDGRIPTDLALPLIQGKVEYDEQGDPTNVADLLTALVTEHPQLAGQAPPNAGLPANPGGSNAQPESDEEALARIYGKQGVDVTRNPEQHGGGVFLAE